MDNPGGEVRRQGAQGPSGCAGSPWPCTANCDVLLGSCLCLLEEAVWLNISTTADRKVAEVCGVSSWRGQSKGCW